MQPQLLRIHPWTAKGASALRVSGPTGWALAAPGSGSLGAVNEAQFRKAELRARVITALLAGHSRNDVRQHLALSPYRFKRIIASAPGLAEELEHRESRAAADREAAAVAAAVTWSRGHVGDPIEQGADALNVPVQRLRRLLGARASLHKPRPSFPLRYTDEEILDRVSRWVQAHGVSGVGYQKAARAAPDMPSLATVCNRFGSWNGALRAAGVTPVRTPARTRTWTDDKLAAVVKEYFAEARSWSRRDLGVWLDADPSRPSLATVCNGLGTWSDLTPMATNAGQRKRGRRDREGH